MKDTFQASFFLDQLSLALKNLDPDSEFPLRLLLLLLLFLERALVKP